MHADLEALHVRNEELRRVNEELRRGLRNNQGQREQEEMKHLTPPREFSTPFSQEILGAAIPNTFAGPKAIFTGMEDPEAHLTAFHTQMVLVGGFDAARCKLFMSTLTGMAIDWFISFPNDHITSFQQLSQLFREQYLADPAGNSNVEESLCSTLCPVYATAYLAMARLKQTARIIAPSSGAQPSANSMSGKDRRLALLELAKRRGTKGTGSSSSTTEPIAAPPLSVAPAEGPEQEKKRKRLVKASTSFAAAASTEEESSGSPLTVSSLDCAVVELRAETSSLRQLNTQLVGELESTKEAAATAEKKLEEVAGKLSKAQGQLAEAASSLAAVTTERDAAEASKQKLEAEKADLMNLDELVRSGFLKAYVAEPATTAALPSPAEEQAHEMPVLGEVHTIAGGFSGRRPTASQRKKYARGVNSIDERISGDPWESDLLFTRGDLRDVVPHDNDPVVISVVMAGRKVHRVLVDQGSSVAVMFWSTFNKLRLSPDLLRPYTGCLYGFADHQVEVRGYLELRTTFMDGETSRTESIRYLVVNANSTYNILLG
ncbi:uncharacterized protein [Phaseolus vulgaris]|uniref:uncharacterized protein n=1 Tax=Phaseolus vulgaris TaxID=3885 RepID=UPI0035CBF1E8